MFHLLMIGLFFIGDLSAKGFIDVNDILNVDYMPGSLLLLEGTEESHLENIAEVDGEFLGRNVTKNDKSDSVTGGSILEAYSTMGYHRKMMNEYLCRSFVADQILSDMPLTRIRRRLGPETIQQSRADDVKSSANRRNDINLVKDNLLSDEGSANYKHWLTKSTTLEDIYRHYENQIEDRGMNIARGDDDEDEDQEADEYEGEVTGYTVQGHIPQGANRGSPSKVGYGGPGGGGGGGGGFGHSGYGGGQSGYGNSGYGAPEFNPQHVHYHHGDFEESGKDDKELKLSELFEIALTAIAFLSFGCYILQVIMCLTNSSTTTTAVTMMPMMMTMPPMDTGDDEGSDEDEDQEPVRVVHRYKRSTENTINERLNELSKRVLLSIESALVAEEDEGNCLRLQLCENNKYSRTLKDNQKIWVPVWSFGMSYLSGRFVSGIPPATTMLDSLKASILGLGNGNCQKIYPNCNLSKMREDRRRRRRKRSTEE